jgi:hypothetical protein
VALSYALSQAKLPNSFGAAPVIVAAGLAFWAAWILRLQDFETLLGGWLPISVTGMPIVLAANAPGAAVVITLMGMHMLRVWRNRAITTDANDATLLLFEMLAQTALVVLAFAHSFVALLIGLGLVNGMSFLGSLLAHKRMRLAATTMLFQGSALVILVIVAALHASQGNSLYFPLMRVADYLLPMLHIAVFLQCGFVPLMAPSDQTEQPLWRIHACAALLVQMHLPNIGAVNAGNASNASNASNWLLGLALLSAVWAALRALSAVETPKRIQMLSSAVFFLACASSATSRSAVIAAAACAWLLGHELVLMQLRLRFADDVALFVRLVHGLRALGVAVWLGVPLSVGFVGQAGVAAALALRGGGTGLLLVVMWVLALALVTKECLGLASSLPSRTRAISADTALRGWSGMAVLVLALLIGALGVLFGLLPQVLGDTGLGSVLARQGVVGWLAWLVAMGVGAALWRAQPRLAPVLDAWRGPIQNLTSLRVLHEVWRGAVTRIAQPFRLVFPFLESDGALLWAIALVLLVVLVARPGGP